MRAGEGATRSLLRIPAIPGSLWVHQRPRGTALADFPKASTVPNRTTYYVNERQVLALCIPRTSLWPVDAVPRQTTTWCAGGGFRILRECLRAHRLRSRAKSTGYWCGNIPQFVGCEPPHKVCPGLDQRRALFGLWSSADGSKPRLGQHGLARLTLIPNLPPLDSQIARKRFPISRFASVRLIWCRTCPQRSEYSALHWHTNAPTLAETNARRSSARRFMF